MCVWFDSRVVADVRALVFAARLRWECSKMSRMVGGAMQRGIRASSSFDRGTSNLRQARQVSGQEIIEERLPDAQER